MHESCIIIYWVSTQDRVPAPFDRLLPEAESTRGEPVSTYNALVLNNDFDNLQTQRMDNRSRQRIHRTRDMLEFFLINSNFQKFKSCNGGLKYTVLGSWLNKFVNCFIRIAKNFQKINGIPNKNQTVQ